MLLNGTLVLSVYYTSWSMYSRNFPVYQLPITNLTHVNYAFANVNTSGHVYLTDLWADVGRPDSSAWTKHALMGNLGAIYEYKRQNPKLKVSLSVGGWGGSAGFSSAAASNQTRKTFAKTALELLITLGLDYIDLDWEYPVAGGAADQLHTSNDGRNYVLLLQEIRGLFVQAVREEK